MMKKATFIHTEKKQKKKQNKNYVLKTKIKITLISR